MKKILVNYNFTPDWLDDDYLVYDRSDSKEYLKDFDQSKIRYTDNIGNVDYDKLSYLVDNYDTLPDVFLWGKTNLFKFITQEEFEKVKDATTFTPLLTQHHKTYSDEKGIVCFYKDGMYHERNDSWYLSQHVSKFASFDDFVKAFNIPNPEYIPFPPGGNYILTKETVHKYPKSSYEKLRDILPYTRLPGEAHLAERCYYLLWR